MDKGKSENKRGVKYAYVTLLSSDNYLPGVIGLFQSVRETGTIYPFVVVVTSRVKEETILALQEFDMTIVTAPLIDPPKNVMKYNEEIGLGVWNNCFDKFHILNLDFIEKIVYLDADMEVRGNIDSLFNVSADVPRFVADPAPYFQITAFKDYTPNNAGMMVVRPSKDLFKEMTSMMMDYSKVDLQKTNEIVSDQSLFAIKFVSSFKSDGFLPFEFNYFYPYDRLYREKFSYVDPKIIHYAGMDKPWAVEDQEIMREPELLAYKNKIRTLVNFLGERGHSVEGFNPK